MDFCSQGAFSAEHFVDETMRSILRNCPILITSLLNACIELMLVAVSLRRPRCVASQKQSNSKPFRTSSLFSWRGDKCSVGCSRSEPRRLQAFYMYGCIEQVVSSIGRVHSRAGNQKCARGLDHSRFGNIEWMKQNRLPCCSGIAITSRESLPKRVGRARPHFLSWAQRLLGLRKHWRIGMGKGAVTQRCNHDL